MEAVLATIVAGAEDDRNKLITTLIL